MCIRRLHADRHGLTVDQICPDSVPGPICGECDGEGFVIANYILALHGMSGRSNNDSIPVVSLKQIVSKHLLSTVRVPVEQMMLAFAAKSYASNSHVNGTEQQAWAFLLKCKSFKRFQPWLPTTLTKQAHALELEWLAALEGAN